MWVNTPRLREKAAQNMKRLQQENPLPFKKRWEDMKSSNPMDNLSTRKIALQKAHATNLAKGNYEKNLTGGNGRGLTAPQQALLSDLSNGWVAEHVIWAGEKGKKTGWPIMMVDLALVENKWAVELDGPSHRSSTARIRDQKKDKLLTEAGWKVLRLKNDEASVSRVLEFFGSVK
jgi:hypothetical protein